MSSSFLTLAEIEALQDCRLSRDTPFAIQGVSQGFFSIARHAGGIVYQGKHYTYMAPTDELVRDDVLKWVAKRRKAEKAAA